MITEEKVKTSHMQNEQNEYVSFTDHTIWLFNNGNIPPPLLLPPLPPPLIDFDNEELEGGVEEEEEEEEEVSLGSKRGIARLIADRWEEEDRRSRASLADRIFKKVFEWSRMTPRDW